MSVKNREDAVRIISNELKNMTEPEICIIYGSAARDELKPSSDLDIAVASEAGLSNEFCLELSIKFSLCSGREVSVLNLAKLEGLIMQEILNDGIRLRNINPNYLSGFIIKMYDFAEDVLPLQLEGIKSNLERSFNE